MKNIVKFEETEIELITNNGEQVMTSVHIAKALGYASSRAVTDLYNDHKAEFDEGFSQVVESTTSGNYTKKVRVFNREGAWLIGMFARTPKAMAFRKWVLKVLGNVADNTPTETLVPVSAHMRRLPSGPREIKLSEKARSEIGGIVKNCCAVAIKEVLETSHISPALPFDPVPYDADEFQIADWVNEATFLPEKIVEELKRIELASEKLAKKSLNPNITKLWRFFKALSALVIRYDTVRAETIFSAEMMRKNEKYSKDNMADEINRLNTVVRASFITA